MEYKVVEISVVTEENLTQVLNDMTGAGWSFDNFNFVVRESSHRPSMAFAIFRRDSEDEEE